MIVSIPKATVTIGGVEYQCATDAMFTMPSPPREFRLTGDRRKRKRRLRRKLAKADWTKFHPQIVEWCGTLKGDMDRVFIQKVYEVAK